MPVAGQDVEAVLRQQHTVAYSIGMSRTLCCNFLHLIVRYMELLWGTVLDIVPRLSFVNSVFINKTVRRKLSKLQGCCQEQVASTGRFQDGQRLILRRTAIKRVV